MADVDEDSALQTAKELTGPSGDMIGSFVDVGLEGSVSSLIQMALETFGKIDILVNNAGIMCRTRLMDISLDEWERTLQINLTGAFLCTKAVLSTMRESEFGRIVNISSSAGRNVSTLGWARLKKSDTLLFFCVRTKPHTFTGASLDINGGDLMI